MILVCDEANKTGTVYLIFAVKFKDLGKVRLSTTTPMPPFWIAVSMATAITSNLESSIERSLSFVFHLRLNPLNSRIRKNDQ